MARKRRHAMAPLASSIGAEPSAAWDFINDLLASLGLEYDPDGELGAVEVWLYRQVAQVVAGYEGSDSSC